jgi:2-polyprenyl-6-methoxyphenol hydroxylase-like FAD-dependent oxidoreductase
MWFAAELALAAVNVTIIEKRPQRSPVSRGFTIHPPVAALVTTGC